MKFDDLASAPPRAPHAAPARFGLVSADLWAARPALAAALGAEPVRIGLGPPWTRPESVLGWADGRGRAARRLARLIGRAFVPVRAGPLALPGTEGCAPASLVLGDGEPIFPDPWTGEPLSRAEAESRAAFLAERRAETATGSVCLGVTRWKQRQIARFLDGPAGPPVFAGAPGTAVRRAAATGRRLVAWETRMRREVEAECEAAGVPLWRMEDGFLRSVGLGAAFLPGVSAVLDGRGMYYDPSRPSDLEHILQTTHFDDALLARARALREAIVAARLSKYNVGTRPELPGVPSGRAVVLVPGQVEDDASVRLGSPRVPGNRALLAAARAGNPDAFLIFKPHPDVEAGLRRGTIPEAEALALADRVVRDASIVDLLDRVDAVETMTSLAGFEALMRGRRTVAHGQPFYAGWGLTIDRDPPPRRTRRLTLDELVAGALILYPRYVDPVTALPCPPELIVRRLAEARDLAASRPAAFGTARLLYARARHALLTPIGRAIRRRRGGS